MGYKSQAIRIDDLENQGKVVEGKKITPEELADILDECDKDDEWLDAERRNNRRKVI